MIDKIVELAAQKGIKQYQLEERAGLSANRISKWKDSDKDDRPNKGKGPSAVEALRIARVLDVPVEFLIDDEQQVVPPDHTPMEKAVLGLFHLLRETEGRLPADAIIRLKGSHVIVESADPPSPEEQKRA